MGETSAGPVPRLLRPLACNLCRPRAVAGGLVLGGLAGLVLGRGAAVRPALSGEPTSHFWYSTAFALCHTNVAVGCGLGAALHLLHPER